MELLWRDYFVALQFGTLATGNWRLPTELMEASKNLEFMAIYAIYCGGGIGRAQYLVDIFVDSSVRIRVKRRSHPKMEYINPVWELKSEKTQSPFQEEFSHEW